MNWLLELNSSVNSIVWGPPMMVVLIGTGIILTIATKGVQFRRFAFATRQVLGRHGQAAGEGTVKPFQALATSLSATVGVGNIAGVSIAVASGGPGAVLWMFFTGVVGMATKFAEIAIALEYRQKDDAGDHARRCDVRLGESASTWLGWARSSPASVRWLRLVSAI